MGIVSSTDPKTESSESKPQSNQVPSEKPGDSSPSEKLGDSSPSKDLGDSSPPSEKLGDSSTVWKDPVDSEESDGPKEGGGGDAEGEEEGECGFCLFMKGGGCKDSFIAWEDCVEEAEKKSEDIVTKCMEVTSTLKKCMDEHSDYYQPILAAEKAAEAEVKKELEAEKNNKVEEEAAAASKQAQG